MSEPLSVTVSAHLNELTSDGPHCLVTHQLVRTEACAINQYVKLVVKLENKPNNY